MGQRLVRDRCQELWPQGQYRTLETEYEHKRFLRMKILEEAAELSVAEDRVEIVEEAADLAEALITFLDLHDVSPEEMEIHRQAKFHERGGFTEGLIWEY